MLHKEMMAAQASQATRAQPIRKATVYDEALTLLVKETAAGRALVEELSSRLDMFCGMPRTAEVYPGPAPTPQTGPQVQRLYELLDQTTTTNNMLRRLLDTLEV